MIRSTRNPTFDYLRILFCLGVIYTHSVRFVDGDNHHEIFKILFGIKSGWGYGFGDICVDGFFCLSGYLVWNSWINRPSILKFLASRSLRLYPALIISNILCLTIIAYYAVPNFQEHIQHLSIKSELMAMLGLKAPKAPIFIGTHHVSGNGSAWTLAHEAKLYLLCLIIGFTVKTDKSRKIVWATFYILSLIGLLISIINKQAIQSIPVSDVIFRLKFLGCFSGGALCYIHKETLAKHRKLIVGTLGTLMIIAMKLEGELDLLIPIFLPAPLIGIATSVHLSGRLPQLPWDLSYGLYIYAWPIQKLWIHQVPHITALNLFIASTLSTAVIAALSWIAIERPSLKLIRTNV